MCVWGGGAEGTRRSALPDSGRQAERARRRAEGAGWTRWLADSDNQRGHVPQ